MHSIELYMHHGLLFMFPEMIYAFSLSISFLMSSKKVSEKELLGITHGKKKHLRRSDIFLASISAIFSGTPMSMQVIKKKTSTPDA